MRPDRPAGPLPHRVVCIVGMHRSGTSMAARTLHLLGVSLGDPDTLLTAGPDNPAGYWENGAVKELDDLVLSLLGGSWDHPPVLDPGWELDPRLDPLRERATEVLTRSFGRVPPATVVGWKDPRLSLLLPFWRMVNPVDATVVVVREPRAVAASLAERDGLDPPQGALLWLRHLLAATEGDDHLLVDQQAFFDHLPATLEVLADHVGVPRPTGEVEATVRRDLDPGLVHHRVTSVPVPSDNPLVAMADAVWNGGEVDLVALAPDTAEGIRRGWLQAPADTRQLAEARARVVALTEEIRSRNRQRDAQLGTRVRRRVRSVRRRIEGTTG